MAKKIATGLLLAAMLAVPSVMQAENLDITFDQGTYEYPLRGFVEYQGDGNSYPNFWVQMPNFNSTKPEAAADGERVLKDGTLALTITGPENFSYTNTITTNPGFPAAESHAWCHIGVLSNPGEYTMTVKLTLNYEDATKQPLVEDFTGKFTVPALTPSVRLNGALVQSDGTTARINYNAELLNYTGAATYLIELFDNAGATGTPVQTKTTAADGFDIAGLTPGTHYAYTIRATANASGLNVEPKTLTFQWDQKALAPKINYTLNPTATGSDFVYNIDAAGYQANQIQSVLVALLKGGEAFTTDAEFHSTTMEGTIPVNFNGDNFTVWLKAELTLTDGTKVQVLPYDQAITLLKSTDKPVINLGISVGQFTRTGATSGTLPYTITASGDLDKVDHYVVWAARVGDENMNVTITKNLEGVLNLDVLPANATTQIWPKVKVVYTTGGESEPVQTETTVSTVAQDMPVISLNVTNPVAQSSTSGTVDYAITLVSGDASKVKEYHIWCVRQSAAGDVTVGELTTAEATGKLTLTNLPDSANTEIWVKAEVITTDGTVGQTVMFPGEPQGWTGLSIDTTTVGIDSIEMGDTDIEAIYNLQGAKIANPAKGQIYIV